MRRSIWHRLRQVHQTMIVVSYLQDGHLQGSPHLVVHQGQASLLRKQAAFLVLLCTTEDTTEHEDRHQKMSMHRAMHLDLERRAPPDRTTMKILRQQKKMMTMAPTRMR